MIVTDSPTKSRTASTSVQWPPQSPRDALLSSPSRRRRLETSTRRSSSPTLLRQTYRSAGSGPTDEDHVQGSIGDDEDEETLLLRLEAIEARLKLKRLQKARKRQSPATHSSKQQSPTDQEQPIHDTKDNLPLPPQQSKQSFRTVASNAEVQVPHSPKSRCQPLADAASPKRIQLGIDKGITAANVSLKRVSSGDGHHRLNRSSDTLSLPNSQFPPTRPAKSFNERLKQARQKDAETHERRKRGEENRSRGFGMHTKQKGSSSAAHTVDVSKSETRLKPPFEVGKASTFGPKHKQGVVVEPSEPWDERDGQDQENPFQSCDDVAISNSELIESFSSLKLSKRYVAHKTLQSVFQGKNLVTIPQLLKTVKPPDYELPDYENDSVLFGIVAWKSTPYNKAPINLAKTTAAPEGDQEDAQSKQGAKNKFLVLKLTDLKWEIDLFLFDTAFSQYWKLTVGTVVAILNPFVMPPKPHMRDTGTFSLKLSSSEDTILEIGTSHDLKWCKAVKKDGKECAQWVDGRTTEYCEFHVSLQVDKAKASRMEINTMSTIGLFGRRGGDQDGSAFQKARNVSNLGKKKLDNRKTGGAHYSYEAHQTVYSVPSQYTKGRSTANLLDAEDYIHSGMSAKERSRKRIAEKEKERDIAKQLGKLGSGLGSEYMRQKRPDAEPPDDGAPNQAADPPVDAHSMGLVGLNASDIKLGPSKSNRLRPDPLKAEPIGWGGAFKRGLPSPTRKPRSPTRDDKGQMRNNASPERKRARFFLQDKGVRVPGRESLPSAPLKGNDRNDRDDDDDDDLVIV